jgi:uncharacterized damage-inducible protein DinB
VKKSDLLFLFEYNYWANDRILQTAAQAAPEELQQDVKLSHGSVLRTLVHAMSAEWVWRKRLQDGTSPAGLLDADNFTTLDLLRDRWAAEEKAMREFLQGLTDEDLNKKVAYKNLQGTAFSHTLWQLLVHVVNHGTQHRSEAAHFLTQFGHSPGDIDLSVYIRQNT